MNIKKLDCVENINLNKYILFKEHVKNHMKYPDWLGDFSKEELLIMLQNGCKIWVYYFHLKAVCSMMLIPATKKSLLKFGLNLNEKEVVDYGPMFVNPTYVGNGLQYQMLKELDDYCTKLGYKYAVCTVHPDNIYSINNLLKDHFEFKNQKEFKRGVRNVYVKKFI